MRSVSTFILLISTIITFSQEMPRCVFSQGGGQASVNNMDLSWTIGQSGLIGTFESHSLILNVGFQQFDNLLVSVEDNTTLTHIKLYPNPFHDQFYLDILSSGPTELTIRLFDNHGKLIINRESSEKGNEIKQLFQAQHLVPGLYSLLVTFSDDNNQITSKYFKVIKQ